MESQKDQSIEEDLVQSSNLSPQTSLHLQKNHTNSDDINQESKSEHQIPQNQLPSSNMPKQSPIDYEKKLNDLLEGDTELKKYVDHINVSVCSICLEKIIIFCITIYSQYQKNRFVVIICAPFALINIILMFRKMNLNRVQFAEIN